MIRRIEDRKLPARRIRRFLHSVLQIHHAPSVAKYLYMIIFASSLVRVWKFTLWHLHTHYHYHLLNNFFWYTRMRENWRDCWWDSSFQSSKKLPETNDSALIWIQLTYEIGNVLKFSKKTKILIALLLFNSLNNIVYLWVFPTASLWLFSYNAEQWLRMKTKEIASNEHLLQTANSSHRAFALNEQLPHANGAAAPEWLQMFVYFNYFAWNQSFFN